MKEIAKRHSETASQLAWALVLAKGEDMIPIPGPKRREYWNAAANIHRTPAGIAEFEAAVPERAKLPRT